MIPDILAPVIQQHVDDLLVLMRQRRRLLIVPDASVHDLFDLDDRISANLEGLRLAHDTGWVAASTMFQNLPDDGSILAAMHLAVITDQTTRLPLILREIALDPSIARSAALAVCWHGKPFARDIAQTWMKSRDANMRLVALHICDLIGLFQESSIAPLLQDTPVNRSQAIWLAGKGGLYGLKSLVSHPLPDDDIDTDQARIKASALLDGPRTVPPALWALAGNDRIEDEAALAIAAFKASDDLWQQHFGSYDKTSGTPAHVTAMGHRCTVADVKWLLDEHLNSPDTAAADTALRRITGIDINALLVREDKAPPPDPFGIGAPPSKPSDRETLFAWWASFKTSETNLCFGRPITSENCLSLLRDAPLPDRPFIQLRARIQFDITILSATDAPAIYQRNDYWH